MNNAIDIKSGLTPTPQEELATLAEDRKVFTLDGNDWDAFVMALDAPPRGHPRLERLFREPSIFRQN